MTLLVCSLYMLVFSVFIWGCSWATKPERPPEADGQAVNYAEGYRRSMGAVAPFGIAGSLLGILVGGIIVVVGWF